MPDPFLDPILQRIERSQRASMLIGTVTAIDAGNASVTVTLSGSEVPGVRWISSYSPVVNDMIVVSRVGTSWVVLGKLSKQLAPPVTIDGTVDVTGTIYYGVETMSTSAWVWSVPGSARQGRYTDAYTDFTFGSVAVLPVPTLPPSATITAARLKVHRSIAAIVPTGLITPRIWQHNYTTAPVGAPSFTGTEWSPGTLTLGETAYWELPSAWLTAWLAGTTKGFGCYSTQLADHAAFDELALTLAYTAPIT